jgi:hypothetical protein
MNLEPPNQKVGSEQSELALKASSANPDASARS